jgi:hypothetical protein
MNEANPYATMTELLEQAVSKAATLPEEQQNALATMLLEEIEDEMRWDSAFAASQDTLAALAAEAMQEHREGLTRQIRLEVPVLLRRRWPDLGYEDRRQGGWGEKTSESSL